MATSVTRRPMCRGLMTPWIGGPPHRTQGVLTFQHPACDCVRNCPRPHTVLSRGRRGSCPASPLIITKPEYTRLVQVSEPRPAGTIRPEYPPHEVIGHPIRDVVHGPPAATVSSFVRLPPLQALLTQPTNHQALSATGRILSASEPDQPVNDLRNRSHV